MILCKLKSLFNGREARTLDFGAKSFNPLALYDFSHKMQILWRTNPIIKTWIVSCKLCQDLFLSKFWHPIHPEISEPALCIISILESLQSLLTIIVFSEDIAIYLNNSMSTCLYHKSMSMPWFNVFTMSPCLYPESFPITRIIVRTMSQLILITEIQQKKITQIT